MQRLPLQHDDEEDVPKTEEEMLAGLSIVKEVARGEGKGKQIEQIKSQMSYRRKILEQPVADSKDW